MKCLFVIDVQNGFVSDNTVEVVPRIVRLMSEFREGLIIATKFVNRGGPFESIIHWERLINSPETDLIGDVAAHADFIIEKRTYTACIEDTLELIHKRDITEAYIAGIDTDCCVLKTALDLFELNVRPVVLADYCASNGGQESHIAALRVLERNIGKKQIMHGEYPGRG